MIAKKLQFEDGKLIGADDFKAIYAQSDPDAFAVENPTPAPAPVPSENDETQIGVMRKESVGYLLDRATYRRYPLREGKQLVGRKPHKNPPKADVPIETTDQGMSREHLYIEVMAGRDGRYHVYVSNAKNQNPTEINGIKLADGDKVGIRHGDVIKLCDTQLVYVGTPINDETEI